MTGDLNAALVEWVVQYRIDDPEQYLFAVRNPDATLRHLSESVMREMVGDRTVDEVITIGRQEIEAGAVVKLQEVTRSYGMGLKIDQVQLKNVNPPQKVQASFNEVNQAQQEKETRHQHRQRRVQQGRAACERGGGPEDQRRRRLRDEAGQRSGGGRCRVRGAAGGVPESTGCDAAANLPRNHGGDPAQSRQDW